MRVWILQLDEPLPTDPGGRRMRYGHLAEKLANTGHEVIWWTSRFDHFSKRVRPVAEHVVKVSANYQLRFLDGPSYRSNVSLTRAWSQIVRARAFRRQALETDRPDIILSAMPTLEMSDIGVELGRRWGVPVVVDVRDKWPDAFIPLFPKPARRIARVALTSEFRRIRRICRRATALFAVSNEYLNWGLRYAGRSRRPGDAVFLLGYDPQVTAAVSEAPDYLRAAGIEDHHFVVCFIGMFGVTYDLATVIKAARLMWQQGSHRVRFVLAGDGPRASEWKALASGLPNVVFPGWLSSRSQIGALLRRANAGLAAYHPEAPQSLPNKPFEYFAGSLPVVSSLSGELADLLARERIGLTYRAGDPSELARCVSQLAATPEVAVAMGQRALHLAKTAFSSDKITTTMTERLEWIARGGHGGFAGDPAWDSADTHHPGVLCAR